MRFKGIPATLLSLILRIDAVAEADVADMPTPLLNQKLSCGAAAVKIQYKDGLVHVVQSGPKESSLGRNGFDAFIGGFLILFGARLAQGCDFGNPVSGAALLNIPSLFAAIPIAVGAMLTDKVVG